MSNNQKVIPELDVSDLDASLNFYVEVVGFRILYQRPDEHFCFLDLDGPRSCWKKRPDLDDDSALLRSSNLLVEA